MKSIEWIEFFQDGDNQLSMTRLLCFMAFWPSAYVIVKEHNSDTLWPFLGAFVGGYVGGKFSDMMGKRGPPGTPDVNINHSDNINIPGSNS